jgi:hypothetical protein
MDKDWDPNFQRIAELIVGKQRNQWILHLFVADAHAIGWVAENPQERQLWRVHVMTREELEYVPPGAGALVPKEGTTQ